MTSVLSKENERTDASVIDSFSLLKSIAEASAVFVGLTFVAGWTYLASYYKTFGLNPMELDVSVPVVAAVAIHMLYNSEWPLPFLAIAISTIAAATQHFARMTPARRWWLIPALILLTFVAAAAALVRGRQNANSDMFEESPELPLVAFASKSEAAKRGPPEQPSCVAYETFGGMDCKLLLRSKGVYYFFRPFVGARAYRIDKLDLFMLPDSEVVGVHIQRGVDVEKIRR